MAKTPLFHTLSRILHLSRRAARAGIPVTDLAEQERSRRALSRRRFLEISAAAAALPLASACGPDSLPPSGAKAIAIVGGGIAGLHCAYRLKKKGVIATVYDASERLGGRMFTDRETFPEGMSCELGGEFIDTGHETMLDLARELSIELLDYSEEDPNLTDIVAYLDGQRLTTEQILTGFAPIAAKIDEALATLTDQDDLFVYHDKPNGGAALDALSVSGWLDSIQAEGPVRELLEVAYTIEYGLEPDVCNALNLLFLISTSTTSFEVFGGSDERFRAREGNEAFPTLLARALDPDQIKLNTALKAIREAPDGRYQLTFQRDRSSVEVTADHVVLALPFSILRELDVDLALPEAKKRAIAEMGYGTNAKLMCGFSGRPWRDPGGSNGETFTDLGYQNTWETSRQQPGMSGIITNFTGGEAGNLIGEGTPEEQRDAFLAQFDQVFPGAAAASNGRVVRFHWPTYPLCKGSYSSYKVGQYTRFAGSEMERVKNVHFCGEHTSLDAQGFMEGGALTGAMAADEILGDLGVPAQMPASAPFDRRAPGAQLWTPEARIEGRARAARVHRRWHAALPRLRQAR